MKNIFLFMFGIFLLSACSKKEEKFELFSTEAFAYSMDNGWELNATVRAKGFMQNENNNKFISKLSYYVDIKTPENKLIEKIKSDVVTKSENEKFSELPIEIQIDLDSNYKTGNYQIIFHVKDELTGKEESIGSAFELNK